VKDGITADSRQQIHEAPVLPEQHRREAKDPGLARKAAARLEIFEQCLGKKRRALDFRFVCSAITLDANSLRGYGRSPKAQLPQRVE
jgi:hypothetical protein